MHMGTMALIGSARPANLVHILLDNGAHETVGGLPTVSAVSYTHLLREMVRETRVDKSSLIYPVFVREGSGVVEEIPSLYGQLRYSPDTLCQGLEELSLIHI